MKTFVRQLLFASFGVLFLFLPVMVFADSGSGTALPSGGGGSYLPSGGGGSLPSGGGSSGSVTLTNPLGVDDFCGLIVKLLQAVVIIATPIAVLLIVYSGFLFVLAQGKPKELGKARRNFMWTCIGIGIFFSAWMIAQVIGSTVSAVSGVSFCGNSTTINYNGQQTTNGMFGHI